MNMYFPFFLRKPFSNLFIISDQAKWVLDEEAKEIKAIAESIGIKAKIGQKVSFWGKNCYHFTSASFITNEKMFKNNHRFSFDYYHGLPEKDSSFKERFEIVKRCHTKISRIRVSQSQIYNLILSSGIEQSKVFLIPIGINLNYFKIPTIEEKKEIRKKLGIPVDTIVIGSFQKDGSGWGDGMEPKLIKGPDILLKTIAILKEKIPNLWVLLTGPARGFVKAGLEKLKVPYIHKFFEKYAEIGCYYQVIDAYIISSREEGGPKAVLESMASGVPLITTKVGQAIDLVKHGENGFMVDVEDYEGLSYWTLKVIEDTKLREEIIKKGVDTAAANTYSKQIDLWKKFFAGYVEF